MFKKGTYFGKYVLPNGGGAGVEKVKEKKGKEGKNLRGKMKGK
jgi:hypothetical protein